MNAALLSVVLAAPGLGFKVPAGWVDLSPGAPAANFARVPAEMARQVKAANFIFFAADADHAGAFTTNANALLVGEKARRVTDDVLDEAVKGLLDEIAKAPGRSYTPRDKAVLDIGGVSVGRFSGELSLGVGQPVSQVGYVLPAKDGMVVLTFSTTKEQLASYQPVFEAAVRATTGLVQPEAEILPPWFLGALVSGSVAVGLAINQTRQKKKSRKLWEWLEPVLKKGPATLPELQAALGMTGLFARGQVALALNEMTTAGRLEVTPAPAGTPQLKKVQFIKYGLRS